jgi:hypothetical protein
MRVEVIHSVPQNPAGNQLLFQWCVYHFDHGDDYGYRFIWWSDDRGLHPDRGQALIPSAEQMDELVRMAAAEGWFVACEKKDHSSN